MITTIYGNKSELQKCKSQYKVKYIKVIQIKKEVTQMKIWVVKWISPFWGFELTHEFGTRKDAEVFKSHLLLTEQIHSKIEVIAL